MRCSSCRHGTSRSFQKPLPASRSLLRVVVQLRERCLAHRAHLVIWSNAIPSRVGILTDHAGLFRASLTEQRGSEQVDWRGRLIKLAQDSGPEGGLPVVPRLCRPPTLATFVLSMVTVLVALACSERITYTLTVTATGDGTVTPDGTTTQYESDEVTLRASWSDATHSFDGWGGECSGTASTCLLTMDANKSVTATFTALPLRYDTLDITGAVATGGGGGLRVPRDGRRPGERHRQLRLFLPGRRRAADPPDRCEREISSNLLRHGAGRRHVRLLDQQSLLRFPVQRDERRHCCNRRNRLRNVRP